MPGSRPWVAVSRRLPANKGWRSPNRSLIPGLPTRCSSWPGWPLIRKSAVSPRSPASWPGLPSSGFARAGHSRPPPRRPTFEPFVSQSRPRVALPASNKPTRRMARMLGNYPLDVVLLATDLESAKDFYANKVGLQVVNDSPGAVTFKCGGDTNLAITKSSVGTKDDQTQAAFRVADVRAEVAELRRRGVKIEEYDMPGLKTQDGIADIGFAWMAWFIDPGKNCIGMIQLKG